MHYKSNCLYQLFFMCNMRCPFLTLQEAFRQIYISMHHVIVMTRKNRNSEDITYSHILKVIQAEGMTKYLHNAIIALHNINLHYSMRYKTKLDQI